MKNPFIFIFLFIMTACGNQKPQRLTIAAAANVQFVMQDLIDLFTLKTGIECDVISGSSGKLTAQIKEGAPYDLFISADMKYPEELYRSGLTTSSPKPYAFGTLVLWTMMGDLPQPTISMFGHEGGAKIKHIAIANPKIAPYGEAAVEVLKYYQLFDSLQPKLVFGESISQVNQFVISKTAEVGFTAKSVVLSQRMTGQGRWSDVPPESYPPIAQGVVVLKNGDVEKASEFYDFLFSAEGRTVLEKYGYAVD